MVRLSPGDRISVSFKEKRKVITKDFTVVAADVRKSFIVVTNGIYKDTIDRFMVDTGKVKIQVIRGGGNGEAVNTLSSVQV